MSIFNRSPKNKNQKDNVYGELRRQVLNLTPGDVEGSSEFPVYAAIVDMDMGRAVATLACVADGTTSLYYSTGGGLIGMGQRYEKVRKATLMFLTQATQVLPSLTKTTEFPLPTEGKHFAYLLTEQGVYTQEIDPNKTDPSSKEAYLLFALSQFVLTTMRETDEMQNARK